jgi:hypothetical protein
VKNQPSRSASTRTGEREAPPAGASPARLALRQSLSVLLPALLLAALGVMFTASPVRASSSWTQVGSAITIAMSTNAFAGLAVTAHNNTQINSATFDKLSVLSRVPTPGLAWAGTSLQLSWPAYAAGLKLYSASNLAPPVVWSAVTNPVMNQAGTLVVSLPVGGENRFFRLGP